jgi:hypothetical protein
MLIASCVLLGRRGDLAPSNLLLIRKLSEGLATEPCRKQGSAASNGGMARPSPPHQMS